MDSYKLAFKLFVQNASGLTGHEFVPVFHSWIQQKKIADHLVIDVADYEHVVDGPGTLVITLEANFATDREDGKLGLLYIRKQPIPGSDTLADRLRATLRPLIAAAQLLESDATLAGKIKFATDHLLFRVYDRLLAPNDARTFAAVKPELENLVKDLYGGSPAALDFQPRPGSLFEVTIKAPNAPKLADLLDRVTPVAR